jgi:hypothetical protein
MKFTLTQWLSLPADQIAEQIRARNVSVMLTSDGTRRHYLMRHPETNGEITDFEGYMKYTGNIYKTLFEKFYRIGIKTILTPILYALNFERGGKMLQNSLYATRYTFLNEPFVSFYKQWDIRVRLYGDYDVAPPAVPIRSGLSEVNQSLADLTPDREQLLLLGYTGEAFMDEIIHRTEHFFHANKRLPTQQQLKKQCFPYGPEKIDIHIGSGWMRTGRVLPFILDDGNTDLYFIDGLTFDLTEDMIKRILYDHLFLRNAAPEDNAQYTPAVLSELSAYYTQRDQNIIGLGEIIGDGIWYAKGMPPS